MNANDLHVAAGDGDNYLDQCMRDLAAVIGDRELTPAVYTEAFDNLPTVFSQNLRTYGPKARETAYPKAVELAADRLGIENPLA